MQTRTKYAYGWACENCAILNAEATENRRISWTGRSISKQEADGYSHETPTRRLLLLMSCSWLGPPLNLHFGSAPIKRD